ncbi:hypothetical protein [Dyadobacter sp. CY312]|uniref:hypothetical protein n=1 Tax=Dyadobacter sp. CY312 TaxID=2907303 RepID=UPI001F3BC263|nr:hypothetical protein [Dyadobacter sp. CY312]MCE7042456.1 hypothetical protein [Dyadobacter sp. CY312]
MSQLKTFAAMAVAIFMAACNSNPTQNTALDTKRSDEDSTFNICYSSIVKKDTVLLNAHMSGDSVTGSLGYKLYEKDQNNGSILGKMYGDTLRGMYTFMSEGKESVREVAFIKKDSLLVEGYGALEEKNGKTVFKDPQQLKFDGIVLAKAPCK